MIEAHVLESTPSIISVGKRCMDMGYSFAWTAGCKPTLTCPSGRTVTLDVINNVPYLPHGDTQFVSPTLDDAEPLPAMPAPGLESARFSRVGLNPRPRVSCGIPGALSGRAML